MAKYPGGETILLWVGVGVPNALLLLAGIGHCLHYTRLQQLLRQQRVASGLIQAAALALVAVEFALPLATVAAIAAQHIPLIQLVLAGTGVLYIALALYAQRLMSQPDVPCGCSGFDTASNRWVVLRATVMVAFCFGASAFADEAVLLRPSVLAALLSALAIGSFAAIAWAAPSALGGWGTRTSEDVAWIS